MVVLETWSSGVQDLQYGMMGCDIQPLPPDGHCVAVAAAGARTATAATAALTAVAAACAAAGLVADATLLPFAPIT